ncbi:WD repeat-containing protein 63 [Triplophysa tibetana]|uniref:WD repeat-containing protein 63 n=1 Tax=Triplophysa tibetana TaxID=1572043 RepID=A0A5A9NAW1_9TELE|nr:WD repeat-containing protein 63 [Triplophysa tibetana]
MSSKTSLSPEAPKKKGKGKKNENNFLSPDDGAAESHSRPDYIFPLVLTSITQELFGCRADEDVTGEIPYKLIKKEDIVQDMKTRAAVSDFSPVKQRVLEYPEDELLLVFDRDFTYGQSFYLVLTVEAKENILKPPVQGDEEELIDADEEDEDVIIPKTPEPRPWISLGSEQEIEEETVKRIRPRLRYKLSRPRRDFCSPVCFSDRSARDGYVECLSYQDKRFNITEQERHTGVQTVHHTTDSSTQTLWRYPKNMWTQYEPREFSPEEKMHQLQSENMKNFITSVLIRLDVALQQNCIMNVFSDDWTALSEDDSAPTGKTKSQLKEYQSFTDLNLSKEKTISHIQWHPSISGVIAVAMIERFTLEERIDNSTKLLLNPSYILFWNLSDPINPQLQLECPDDVLSFQFCPSDPNIIAGGCFNGQIALWDVSAHVDKLQDTRSDGKNTSHTPNKKNDTPVVRYCAVSGIENGHKSPITDVQWLPETFEVSRYGIPVENTSHMCVQIVTCAPDSLTDNTVDYSTGERPTHNTGEGEEGSGLGQLRVPSAKQQNPLEHISTKLFVGTEDGELVYTDWKMEKDNDSGRLFSPKPTHRFVLYDTLINTVSRSPFFKDIILTVGSWSFAVFKEGLTNGWILQSCCSQIMYTVGHWSPSRPAVFFIGKEDGSVEVWDLLEKSHEPSLTQNISTASITSVRAKSISLKQHLLAVSDRLGTLHILQIPWTLRRPSANEMQIVKKFFEREEERLNYFEKRQTRHENAKKETNTEEQRKKTESVIHQKHEEETNADAQREYEEYLNLEKMILKDTNLLTADL